MKREWKVYPAIPELRTPDHLNFSFNVTYMLQVKFTVKAVPHYRYIYMVV